MFTHFRFVRVMLTGGGVEEHRGGRPERRRGWVEGLTTSDDSASVVGSFVGRSAV